MRVDGRGKQYGGSASRTEAFRKTHRVGQKVRGRVLKWQEAAMAWIAIDGQPLLANLSSRPAPGSVLAFKIISLHPHIHLQEIFDAGGMSSALTGVMAFTEARRKFQTAMEPHSQSLEGLDLRQRIIQFARLLNDPKLMNAYAQTQMSVDSVNGTDRKYCLRYSPLLLPEARDQATFLRTSGDFTEVIHEFTLPRLGDAQVHFMHKSGKTSYRVKLRRTSHIETLRKVLERSKILAESAQYIGTERLTGPPGGMLANFLAGRTR